MKRPKKKLPPFLAKVAGGNAQRRADRKAYQRGGAVSKADVDPISPNEPNAPAGGKVTQKFKSGGVLSAAQRQSLPKSDFALPGKGTGPKGAGSGSYPIPDRSHAQNALARSSGKPVAAQVRAKVKAKYPDMGS
jgi:hypothetical protein